MIIRNNNMEKIKKIINKHYDMFVFFVITIIITGTALNCKTDMCDELWNFQNIYKMYNGYKIYIDANVITTPLFHFIGLVLFKVLGANFLIFKIYNSIVNILLFWAIYKILKLLKIPLKLSSFLTIFIFILEITSVRAMANYNTLALMFCLYGVIIIINKDKLTFNRFTILQSIFIFLIFITKQNIGAFYYIGFLIWNCIFVDKKEKNKIFFTILLYIIIYSLLFIWILYVKGLLFGFIDYAILGIKEFAIKNNSFKYLDILKMLIIVLMNTTFIIFLNKHNKIQKRNIINQILLFSYPLLISAYPIFNWTHINLALIFQYIILAYVIYVIFDEFNISEKLINKLNVAFIFSLLVLSIINIIIYFIKIDYNYEYSNLYFGSILDEKTKQDISEITEFITKSNKKVIVLDSDAPLYMMPLKMNNGFMDEPLLGNLGKKGEDGLIIRIKELKNTIILIRNNIKVWQESVKANEYIKNNFEYIGDIKDYLIYETKN